MSGVKLFLLFSLPPNKLGFCGSQNQALRKKIQDFLKNKSKLNKKDIDNFIKSFKAAFPYLKLIAQANKITNPLSYKVVEAYWIGNALLKKVKNSQLKLMIKKEWGREISLTKKVYPHHSFHVFFMEPINSSLKITFSFKKICIPRWGEVIRIKKDKLWVKIESVLNESQDSIQKWTFNPDIFPSLKEGDQIVGHLKELCCLITQTQKKNLKFFTNHNLRAFYEKKKT